LAFALAFSAIFVPLDFDAAVVGFSFLTSTPSVKIFIWSTLILIDF